MMNVLGLCSYPIESAATRYRLAQFVEPLRKKGINLEVSPFLDSRQFELFYQSGSLPQTAASLWKPLLNRFAEISKARRYDLLFVQREAMFFGPAFFEKLFQMTGGAPLILDLDDATYVRYVSPTYGRIGSFFKFFGKTDKLIRRAETVICGNRFIAEYAAGQGAKTAIVPTVVDTDKFHPIEKSNAIPVIGWIGTHSTFSSLASLFPVLQELARKYEFILRIVGAGKHEIAFGDLRIDNRKWSLEREIADFQSLDIGLYPIETSSSATQEWLIGKSGFKSIQYMSVGIPFVVTPIGICAEMGIENETHFSAATETQWFETLAKLLESSKIRREMGEQGRKYALEHYTIAQQVGKIEKVFREVVSNGGKKLRS